MDKIVSALVSEADRARRRGDTSEHRRAMSIAAHHLHVSGRTDDAINVYLSMREYASAATLSEEAGDNERAAQIWYRSGEFSRAAVALARAGEAIRAAELFEQIGDHGRAARLYAKQDEPMRAAAAYERASQPLRAAQSYVAALKGKRRYGIDDVQSERICRAAALCYEAAGEVDRAVRVLELGGQRVLASEVLQRAGRHDEAARVLEESLALQGAEVLLARARAGEAEAYELTIQSLASISEDHAAYLDARVMLAEVLVEQEDPACATRVLRRLLEAGRFTTAHLPALYLYGTLLHQDGRVGEARGTFRSILELDSSYRDAAARLVQLGETGELTVVTEPLAAAVVPTMVRDHTQLVGATLRDRFRLDRLLGSGSQAEVFAAHDIVLDRPVAIKILNREHALDPKISEAFLQEARYAARVHHRACLDVYDFGVENGLIFIAMELCEGYALSEMMGGQRLDLATALATAHEIASALSAVHAVGIVHRDVKPGNVLVDRGGRVRLADFGVATSIEGAETIDTSARPGTLGYMAPEQADPTCVDVRSDVYALGIVMFEMLTGKVPFESSVVSLVARLLEPPPEIHPYCGVPNGVSAIVRRCLEPDPDDRWPSMASLAAVLERAAAVAAGRVVTRRHVS